MLELMRCGCGCGLWLRLVACRCRLSACRLVAVACSCSCSCSCSVTQLLIIAHCCSRSLAHLLWFWFIIIHKTKTRLNYYCCNVLEAQFTSHIGDHAQAIQAYVHTYVTVQITCTCRSLKDSKTSPSAGRGDGLSSRLLLALRYHTRCCSSILLLPLRRPARWRVPPALAATPHFGHPHTARATSAL